MDLDNDSYIMDRNNKIQVLDELKQIVARRNTALTIIESKDIEQTIISIERAVSAIKHKQKRGQLLNVVMHLKQQTKAVRARYDTNTGIFCVCLKMDGTLFFKFIDSTPVESVYHYDDTFHIAMIQRIIFGLRFAKDQEITGLVKYCNTREYFVNQEIMENIDMIRTIYCMIDTNLSEDIPIEYLESEKQIMLIDKGSIDPSSIISLYPSIGIPY